MLVDEVLNELVDGDDGVVWVVEVLKVLVAGARTGLTAEVLNRLVDDPPVVPAAAVPPEDGERL